MKRLMLVAATALVAILLPIAPSSASQYRDATQPVGIRVSQPGTVATVIERCILAAGQAQRLPPAMLVILLHVEGGQLGRVSDNTNATVDIGPMQVNEIWLPEVARHWGVSVPTAFLGLRDDFCANIEAGAWILRRGLDEARGDFWTGVGYYHSHDPVHKANYLRKVMTQALRLQGLTHTRPTASVASGPDMAAPGTAGPRQAAVQPISSAPSNPANPAPRY